MNFLERQRELGTYLRNPTVEQKPSGLDSARLSIYEGLVYRNILRLVSDSYPATKTFFGTEKWPQMVRRYIVANVSETPYFFEIAQSFLMWLPSVLDQNTPSDKFALQLAHYECTQHGLFFLGDLDSTETRWVNDAVLVHYDWPVHKPKQCDIEAPVQTLLVLWRNMSDASIRWKELTALEYLFAEYIRDALEDDCKHSLTTLTKRFTEANKLPSSSMTELEGWIAKFVNQQWLVISTAED